MVPGGIVDEQSGVLESPAEAIVRFRELELAITRADQAIAQIRAALKEANGTRDDAIEALRKACRDAMPLPLFESSDEARA